MTFLHRRRCPVSIGAIGLLRGLAWFALFAHPLPAEQKSETLWSTAVQTGLADTFQLTLGGTFGNGPAWQNRVITGLTNAFRGGDSISVYSWDTFDLRNESHNWQAGIGYKTPVLKTRRHFLSLGSGLQRWFFPSVKTGTNDWLVPGTLLYQAAVSRFSLITTGDSWTLLHSPLPTGSLLHTQMWLQYSLIARERFRLAIRHGPAHTYSWNFYGTNGNRVFRYQTMLAVVFGNNTIEGGWRKQWGLQPGIPNNGYWQFALTRTFNQALHTKLAAGGQ